jgi:hypothetical protein
MLTSHRAELNLRTDKRDTLERWARSQYGSSSSSKRFFPIFFSSVSVCSFRKSTTCFCRWFTIPQTAAGGMCHRLQQDAHVQRRKLPVFDADG